MDQTLQSSRIFNPSFRCPIHQPKEDVTSLPAGNSISNSQATCISPISSGHSWHDMFAHQTQPTFSPVEPLASVYKLDQPMNVATNLGISGVAPSDTAIIPKLHNVVSTVDVGCKLDLKKITFHALNAEYNPKLFDAVVMRLREPKTTALIFRSGKVVCTGAKSEGDSRLALRKYARILQKLGFPAKFSDFKIQNIVCSLDLKFSIRLEELAFSHSQFSRYEPEIFPALVYHMVRPRAVLMIFVSGKILLQGAKTHQEAHEALQNILPILKRFRK